MQFNLLVKPVAEVNIGSSVIYLYPLSIGDVNEFGYLQEVGDSSEKFRKFLPFIASLSVPQDFREKRQPLADELIERMTAEELEQVAAVYMGIPSFDKARAGNAAENVAPIARHAGESAIACLDRLLSAEAERQRRIFDRII